MLDPEAAHRFSLWALARGLVPGQRGSEDLILKTVVWGRPFPNPLGLAAGFDKDAVAVGPALALGFGFVEVGSVTPEPQSGNPAPRVFRLASHGAIVNRLGFPSAGVEAVEGRLRAWRAAHGGGLLGVNLGMNRDSADPAADYALGASVLAPYADYLVINVSSPNTTGLRGLQEPKRLSELIERVGDAIAGQDLPLLVKIAPDVTAVDLENIAEVALSRKLGGLIVGNTTTARPSGLRSRYRRESGGLSGRPLFRPSTVVLAELYRIIRGHVPLIGVGGIFSGADAYAKIRAGASLVQLYTALAYEGPGLVPRIKTELAALLRRDGFDGVAAAVGADHR